ncbi:MAG: LamB/YcsF family protein [Clostridia bacterium]|nr:LamB/YcsF family protein [Clostridia bacterium]MBR5365389.1 LamB/YcsF family protein [Clostridia bacterium]
MAYVDLNADLGESFGAYKIGADEEIIPLVSSVNIACGWHAGDPLVMGRSVKLAKEYGVSVGAHPGYPDLMGFGRRNMKVSPAEVKAYIQYQVGALSAFCKAAGVKLHHVKPHGAMYNMAGADYKLARAVAEAVAEIDDSLPLLALSGSEMVRAANEIGLPCASEVFADRNYEEDGSLRARSFPDSMITDEDECIRRILRMVNEGKITAVTGKDIDIRADSICVHGDNPKALAFVKRIRDALGNDGIGIRPF